MAMAARIRRLGLELLGFERDCSASGGIGSRGTVAVGNEHAEVERPWRGVGVGERGDAADGWEEWAREVRHGPRCRRIRIEGQSRHRRSLPQRAVKSISSLPMTPSLFSRFDAVTTLAPIANL
jgi:hypothetical protein